MLVAVAVTKMIGKSEREEKHNKNGYCDKMNAKTVNEFE